MADIVPLHGDEHLQIQRLLPWYVTGRLAQEEAGAVERHLESCPTCRAELAAEQELARCIARNGFDAAAGWQSLRQRISPRSAASARGILARARSWLTWPMKLGWFLGAQAAMAVALFMTVAPPAPRAEYHALSDTSAPAAGNVIVIFRRDTKVDELGATLADSRAHIVNGPTAAGAYVLQVPERDRAAVLGRLMARPAIVLAQPIDQAAVQ